MEKKVELERRRRIFDDFFKIDEAYVRFEKNDGSLSDPVRRLNFERGDSVSVLIYNATSQKLLFTSQFRYPAWEKGPGWLVETAAGMIDAGETSEHAARREVLEETGYAPSVLTHVSTFYLSPGGSSERIVLYYARIEGSEKIGVGGGLAEENEDIEIVELDAATALRQVEQGLICDAKTIIAILWFDRHITRNPGG